MSSLVQRIVSQLHGLGSKRGSQEHVHEASAELGRDPSQHTRHNTKLDYLGVAWKQALELMLVELCPAKVVLRNSGFWIPPSLLAAHCNLPS